MDDLIARPVGRRLFLSLSALGAGTLLFGRSLVSGNGLGNIFSDLLGQGGFQIYTVAPIPAFDPATWRLTVTGMVGQELQLSYDDLLALPAKIQQTTFHCVTGWSVPNLTWQGVSLQSLLDLVNPHPDAGALLFSSSDGAYTDSLSIDQAHLPDVMLAYNMNGQALPLDQGQPVRLLVPEMYGYKSVKWVNRIELALKPVAGYWEVRGYDIDAYINKSSEPG